MKQISDFLSVREAATELAVSIRTVYNYIRKGQLTALKIGEALVVSKEEVERKKIASRAVGRPRTTEPAWRKPLVSERTRLTEITGVIQDQALLADQLAAMSRAHTHTIPGTIARYIVCNQATQTVKLILIWREDGLPNEYSRVASLAALCAYLTAIAWEETLSAPTVLISTC